MTDMIANSLCSLINRAFPHLVAFVSSASGGAVIAATLGVIIAFILGYKGLQYAVNGERKPRQRAARRSIKRRFSWLSDEEEFDPDWMDYELSQK